MKTFTIADIRALGPCYDPARYLPKNWQGTAIDILNVEACPAKDRLWVVLRNEWIEERPARLFAVWCARQALARVGNPDPRSVAACDVAERYASGQATPEELSAAWDAAWNAVWATAELAAKDAANNAANNAAWNAANGAAWDAANGAALHAANNAAWDAAWNTVWDAAWDAAWETQLAYLRKLLKATEAVEAVQP